MGASGRGGSGPPRVWEGLLRRLLPSGVVGESILGDLREEHGRRAALDVRAAGRWYRRAAAGVGLRALAGRFRRGRGVLSRVRPGPSLREGGGGLRAAVDIATEALRSVRRAPRLALTVAVTLALGLGANVTVFRLVDRLLLSPPEGVRDPGTVRRLLVERPAYGTGEVTTSSYLTYPDYQEFRKLGTFAGVAAYTVGAFERTLGRGEGAVRIRAKTASSDFFRLLGVEPIKGRLFTPEDAAPGATSTAILTEPFWRRRFGGDEGVLGRVLEIGDGRYTVVGITPAGFTGADLAPVDVFLQFEARAEIELGGEWRESRNWWWFQAVARLAPGVDPRAGEEAATAAYRAARPDGAPDARMVSASLVAADDPEAPSALKVTRWLAGVSLLVLLIACANVANLLLVRGARRRRELSVQRALGLGRRRLVAGMLVESLVLAALGGGAALLVAQWGGAALNARLFPEVEFASVWSNGRIVAFTVLAVLATTCLAGLVPALKAGRGDLLTSLREGARGASPDRSLTRSVLVAVQGGLTVVLLVGAGLFVGSLHNALSVDLGFDPGGLLTVSPELDGDPSPDERVDLYYRLVQEVGRIPGVEAATFYVAGPFQGTFQARLDVEGRDSLPRVAGGGPYTYPVGPDYFETMGMEVLRGRGLSAVDHRPDAEKVAVVNETMARTLWPGGDALGRCLYIREGPCTRTVGVVDDVARGALVEDPSMMYYVPFRERVGQVPGALVVRRAPTGPDPVAALRDAIAGVAGGVRYVQVRRYQDILEPYVRSWRLGALVFSAFGVLAVLVAGVGLYSTLAFQVAQRRHELGIRSALGAPAERLVTVVVVQSLAAVLLGAVAGGALAFVGARRLESLLFGVSALDPASYLLAGAALVLLAALSVAGPAWRATRADPVRALRGE